MAEEKDIQATEEVDYIQAIADLKANTVSKDQYSKLKEENQKLLKAMINGEEIAVEAADKPSIADLRKELYGGEGFEGTNLDFVKKTLELRNAIIEEKGVDADPFLPKGREYSLQPIDYVTADKVANTLQECIDFASGDSGVFTAELQRRMQPSALDRGKK